MFFQMLLVASQIAFAEPTEDTVEAEINEDEIQGFYEAKKTEETKITVDVLSEEDFDMDLSGLSTPVVNATVETAVVTTTINEGAAPTQTVQAPAETLEWNLDLTEDLEIGDKNLKLAPEAKSEPVNLDFLNEEVEDNEDAE